MGALPFVWDYDVDEATFRRLLSGEITLGRLDRTWAAVRLIEYAPYREIVRLLGFRDLVKGWPGCPNITRTSCSGGVDAMERPSRLRSLRRRPERARRAAPSGAVAGA